MYREVVPRASTRLSFMFRALALLLASVTLAAGGQPQFKSGVEVVYLDVTVQAPDGSIVRGLAKDDFLIYDEEAPQD